MRNIFKYFNRFQSIDDVSNLRCSLRFIKRILDIRLYLRSQVAYSQSQLDFYTLPELLNASILYSSHLITFLLRKIPLSSAVFAPL